MPVVFQYGSNALPGRLNGPNRLNNEAKDLGRAETVEEYDIVFDVYSQTNGCAASNLVRTPRRKVWGVLYKVPGDRVRGKRADGQKTLAQIEGPRYEETSIRVLDSSGRQVDAIIFLVREKERRAGLATSAAYVSWIVYGLREHGVPEEYIGHVVEVAIATNTRARKSVGEQTKLIKNL